MKPRIIPSKLLCHNHGNQITTGSKAAPRQDQDPVNGKFTVTVYLKCGCKRYFGVENAYINSRLEMVCQGGFVNPNNELAKKWPIPFELMPLDTSK